MSRLGVVGVERGVVGLGLVLPRLTLLSRRGVVGAGRGAVVRGRLLERPALLSLCGLVRAPELLGVEVCLLAEREDPADDRFERPALDRWGVERLLEREEPWEALLEVLCEELLEGRVARWVLPELRLELED